MITLTYRIKDAIQMHNGIQQLPQQQNHQLGNDADASTSITCINGNFVERKKTCFVPPQRPNKQRVIVRFLFIVSCTTRSHIFTQKGIHKL